MVIFNKKWKKYNEIQLTKNIMDLNIRKMTNHPPSPDQYIIAANEMAHLYPLFVDTTMGIDMGTFVYKPLQFV